MSQGIEMVAGLTALLLLGLQPEGPPHIGGFTPNSQLLRWCKSEDPREFAICWAFISGVIESSGMSDAQWPKGAIQLPYGMPAHRMVPIVVRHIEQLEPEAMSDPAVRSVYDAVVAVHPRRERASEAQ